MVARGSDKDPLEDKIRRMGDASWFILRVLNPVRGLHGIEIIRKVEALLEEADYPYKRLDPSTVHYALKRMQEDDLIACQGEKMVDVPGPRGSVRSEARPVYVITGTGVQALVRRQQLEAIMQRKSAVALDSRLAPS